MKTYGVLLAGLLLASTAVANETEELSEGLTLASAKTGEAIRVKTEQELSETESLQVLDLDVVQASDELADKISAKLDQQFEEDMKRRLGL